MAGTIATYQGFPLRAVTFRRTRGWRADTSTALLFAADFPQGFQFVTPTPGNLRRPTTSAEPDLSAIRGPRLLLDLRRTPRRPRQAPRLRRLEFEGTLVLAEVDSAGREYLVRTNLYCVKLETVKRTADGSVAIVRATLVDERYFYSQGFLRRWSYNRTDARGVPKADSTKSDGALYSLGEIAIEVAGSLFDQPTLAHYPRAWDQETPETELRRFGSAALALAKLAREHHTEDLCLSYEGQVALWKPGEGKLGYARDGKGAQNNGTFPPGLRVYLQGTGQSQGSEAGFPPDYVVVVGGLRIASVRLDRLDPVLVIEGEPFPLTEETVKKLTKNKHGLEWLAAFVLAPQAYQNDTGLLPELVQLFREQAWRLWRIPDVERQPPGSAGAEPAGTSLLDTAFAFASAAQARAVRAVAGPPTAFEANVAVQRELTRQRPPKVPGKNAHLIPLRDRAETVAGQRLPVRVDAYRFKSVHRAMASTRDAAELAHSRKRRQALKDSIQRLARRLGKRDPFHDVQAFFLFQDRYLSSGLLRDLTRDLRTRSVSHEDVQAMVERARLIDRIGEVSGELARSYEQELAREFALSQEAGGIQKSLWDLAKELVAFEKEVAESRSAFETPDQEARERAEELKLKLQDNLRELDRVRQQQQTRARTGSRALAKPQTAVFLKNLPRKLDPHATVYSAALGIVRTSERSGHVKDEGVPVAEATSFMPKSPLVTFGAVLRPRIDRGRSRPVTGQGGPDESKVPEALSDRESYYVAAFRRQSRGRAVAVALGEVPVGEGLPVERPDLVELIPLEEDSNKPALDQTAEGIAAALFQEPEQREAQKLTYARPWPVVCDGVVAGVEIALRPNGKGFLTTIYTGSSAEPVEGLGATRVRRPVPAKSDKVLREGLS